MEIILLAFFTIFIVVPVMFNVFKYFAPNITEFANMLNCNLRNLFGSTSSERILNAYELKTNMVSSAYKENARKHKKFKKRVERILHSINSYLIAKSRAKQTELTIVFHDNDNNYKCKHCGKCSDLQIIMPCIYHKEIYNILRKAYAKNGYHIEILQKSSNTHLLVSISWKSGMDVKLLDKIIDKSQVDSFRYGVPLEDIV